MQHVPTKSELIFYLNTPEMARLDNYEYFVLFQFVLE